MNLEAKCLSDKHLLKLKLISHIPGRFRYVSYDKHHLYTNITVDVGHPSREMVDFISQSLNKAHLCTWDMPWMKLEKVRKSPLVERVED